MMTDEITKRKRRILVVDDDAELCQVITDTLKEKGYDAFYVQTAEDGYDKAVKELPDLLLSDLEIPQMGGLVLCQKIKSDSRTKHIPFIFITVRDSNFDRRTALALGADQYLTKPFRRSQLLQEVAEQLARSEADWIESSPANEAIKKNAIVLDAKESARKNVEEKLFAVPPQPRAETPKQSQESEIDEDTLIVDEDVAPGQMPPSRKEQSSDAAQPKLGDSAAIEGADSSAQEEKFESVDVSESPVLVPPSAPKPPKMPLRGPAGTRRRPPPRAGKPQAKDPGTPHSLLAKIKNLGGLLRKKAPTEKISEKEQSLPQPERAPENIPAPEKKSSAPRKNLSIVVALVLLAACGGGAWWYWHHEKTKYPQEANPTEDIQTMAVNILQVVPQPYQDILQAVGTVAGGSEIELRFQSEGNIAQINFKEGDTVKRGQMIAMIDQTQAKLKYEKARSEYYRYEKLYALGGVAKSALEESRIQMDYAKADVEKTVLVASKNGILGDRNAEVGEFVTPQKKIGTLVSLDSVLVRIGVIEKEINKLFPGQPVTCTVDSYPGMEFKGKVENISPLVQGQSKTLTVEARMPNDGKMLLPGMFARTKIVIYQKDDAIVVPNEAVEKTQAGYQVFVVNTQDKAELRAVEVGYVSLTQSVISKGLQIGDKVIIQKPQDLKNGSPVKVIESQNGLIGVGNDSSTMSLGGSKSKDDLGDLK